MKKHYFTLLEILSVTVLIAVLAAIGIAGYTYAVDSSKESATKALIARMTVALEDMRKEGKMKKTLDGGAVKFVKVKFSLNPTGGDRLKFGDTNSGDAYDIFAKAVSGDSMKRHINSQNEIVDGWGGAVYVRYPGKFNRGGFDIVAPGKDGAFGKDAKAPDKINTLDKNDWRGSDGEWICDDIANF